jgi:threonine synthase
LGAAGRTLTREALVDRVSSMWRYAEVLPAPSPDDVVSLGEGWTPLLAARGSAPDSGSSASS